MKKLLFIACIFCSGLVNAQDAKLVAVNEEIPLCPPGFYPTYHITLDLFNFHRPRTGCTSGFGLCIKLGLTINCSEITPRPSLSGTTVNGYTKLSNTSAEIHLPLEIKNSSRFIKQDMSKFVIGDNMLWFTNKNGQTKWARGGSYNVSVVNQEYVITVPIY
ncbi:MAG: hypothetical protein FGM46_01175 [Ferruginibacter sp.]|nr:hypothetical protein [Ferruginibacter sp.]